MQKPTHLMRTLALCTGVAALAFSTVLAASAKRHGTDILHFFVRETMTNDGALTNATGKVDLGQNQQGKANNQRLDITLHQLDPNGTYQLLALLNGDLDFTPVTEFQANSQGDADLHYRKVGSSNGRGKGMGKGKNALPAVLDPISNIRELMVSVNSTQSVLHADLTAPDKLQYLIKRDLSTNDVDATLSIKATTSKTQFRLTAAGLNPTNAYFLALNGSVVQTNSADAKGKLAINSLLVNPGDILDLHAVALWDSASNVVVSTTLP
jgi:hypothetical protein